MKINAKLTLLFNHEGLHLEVHDEDASITFLDLTLDAEQTCHALARGAYTKVKTAHVRGLENVGKKIVSDSISVVMPPHDWKNKNETALKALQDNCPEGWKVDSYLGSKENWFFKDGVQYVRGTIRKWVDKEGGESV